MHDCFDYVPNSYNKYYRKCIYKDVTLHTDPSIRDRVHPKSLEISPAVGDFYGTEIDILADCTGPKFGQHRDHLHCTAK